MKKLIKTTVVTLALSLTTLYAGSGHSHDDGHDHGHTKAQKEVSKSVIEKTANQKLAELVKNKKIKKNWLNVSISNMEKKKFNSKDEWIVSFNNNQIKDKNKQTLYIFVDEYGKVTGANYTGN
ncbi:MAG: DUF6488 family protein [Sulfurimonas sp.]|nr:DUF6488 family protein [Sulfurimonas sp.]